MGSLGLIMTLVIGGLAGWLAGTIMKGGGFGILLNILLGIIGAVVGDFAFGLLGMSIAGLIGQLISATVGALIVLFIAGLFRK